MPVIESVPQAHESKLYSEFSHIYDRFFGRVFYQRIAAVIPSLRIPPGARVLELGVGTGVSLGCYPPHCQVTGIDLAPEMLEHARDKIDENGWSHVRVMEMDAMNLQFADSTFDYVMAFHVVSVVPDVHRLMAEALRVLKPGGSLVVINHFRSRNRLLASLDKKMEPVTRRWGWHTLDRDQVFGNLPLEIVKVWKTSRSSLFTIVIARSVKEAVSDTRAAV